MVALHSFLDHLQVLFELLLIRESIQIYSLHLVPVLIASPVSAGNRLNLESNIHQKLGIVDVRSAAEIHEVVAGVVDSDLLVLGKVADKLG